VKLSLARILAIPNQVISARKDIGLLQGHLFPFEGNCRNEVLAAENFVEKASS